MGVEELLGPPTSGNFFRVPDEKVRHNEYFTGLAESWKSSVRAWLDAIDRPTEQDRALYDAEIERINEALSNHIVKISSSEWGQNLSFSAADSPQQLAYGFCRIGGVRTFVTADTGESGEFLHVFITYAGHQVQGPTALYLDGKLVTFPGPGFGGRSIGPDWPDTVFASDRSKGADDQPANSDLVSQSSILFPGKWTANHRQRGSAGLYLFMYYDSFQFINGFPEIAIEGYWKNDIYDPRTGLYGYTNNAVLCLVDYLCSTKFGPGFNILEHFDLDNLIEAANICDEDVDLAGGGTEKRYTVNGAFFASRGYNHQAVKEDFERAFAGKAVWRGGKWYFYPGKWRAPTITLSEKNLRSDINLQVRPSKRDIFNGVRGKYRGAASLWELTDYPPVKNATYQGEDGAEFWQDIDLPFTSSPATCQRIGKILLEDSRQWEILEAEFDMNAYPLTPGETVALNIERFGYEEKPFQVIESELRIKLNEKGGPVLTNNLVLKSTAEGIYDWNNGEETEVDLSPNTNLPNPGTVRAPAGLVLTSGTTELDVRADGTVFSRIKATWNPSVDAFVLSGGQHEIQAKKSVDNEWRTAGFVNGTENKFWLLDVQDGVNYDVRVRAFTPFGKSDWLTETNFYVTGKLAPPSTPANFSVRPTLKGLLFSWERISDLDIGAYEIRLGAWADEETIVYTDSTQALWETVAAGSYSFELRAKDTSENFSGSSATASIVIDPPSAVQALLGVSIYNMIKLTWQEPATTSFPVAGYKIYRGAVEGSATLLGEVASTIMSLQEQVSGTHTFWVSAFDIHKNEGAKTAVVVSIQQLPFFNLLYDEILDPDDAITFDYAVNDFGKVIAPVNATETFEDHFIDNSFATPQAQVTAGYPLFIQPASDQTAVVEWKVDYGVEIPGSLISFTYQAVWKDGSGTITPQVSYSDDDISYTDLPGEQFVQASDFRYVKVMLEIEGDDDTSIAEISFPRLRFEAVKEARTVVTNALSSDGSGTLVDFGADVVDVLEDTITVSVKGSSPYFATWTISGNDVRVFAWNTSGIRVTADVSVTAEIVKI